MSITVPYSLELTQDEGAKDAVADTAATAVAGKMKIFIGSNVTPAHRQAYVGTLKAAFAKLKSDKGSDQSATTKVIYGSWNAGSSGAFTVADTTAGITATDVAIVVSDTFNIHRSHMADETFKQLINVLLEKTKGN